MNNRILIIAATNRKESNSLKVAKHYQQVLKDMGEDAGLYGLENLPGDFMASNMYGNRTPEIDALIKNQLEPAEKYVFVLPEYNGGFPGAIKLLLDGVPPATWHGKKAALVGVSSGHLGNTRGMDSFTNVLNYLQVSVFFQKPKLSGIESILNDAGEVEGERAKKQIASQAAGILEF